jgi:hypothetical protein
MAGRKRLALMGLMVCLPIPLLAASGLAVPLPSVVYRVAVGVAERTQAVAVRVPGFEAVVTETKQVARRGTIRFSAEELAVAAKPSGGVASATEDLPNRTSRAPRAAGRAVHRTATPRRVARPLSVRRVSPVAAEPELGTRAVAAPANRETPRASDETAREERAPAKKDSVPAAEVPGVDAATSPRQPPETKTAPPRDEPRTSPPKQEPKNTPGPSTAPPPPPPPATPPASLPPLPVTPPIDPLPDPLPLTPKAQLEAIAAELRQIAGTGDDDDGGRVGQAVEKVESAVERLEKTPPDKQGAVGDIKNAVQKLDDALSDGEIGIAQRILFVTRLNAVSQQLKGGS